MDIISESQYIFEKQAFKKLLIDARMHEIVYAENTIPIARYHISRNI